MTTRCEELTHWKKPWCWQRLKAGDGGDRGWDGWMASWTRWTWVWASSRSWWWAGMLQSMVSQRVRHNWATNLTEGTLGLIFWGTVKLFSKAPGPLFHIFTSNASWFQFLHILANTHHRVFISVIPTGMQRHLIIVLVCFSPRINDIEHLFICHVYILFWRNIKSFGHFKSGLFVLSKSSKSSLYILDINRTIYIDICFTNIFSHSVDHLFTFFMVSFEAPLVRYIIIFVDFAFRDISKKSLIQRIFYSISFIILALKFSFISILS